MLDVGSIIISSQVKLLLSKRSKNWTRQILNAFEPCYKQNHAYIA